ncbi:hypothetical protein AGLY_001973 [Aphis glycines]|uniref:Uncharacterized protein n=1 Tax=Aphis glycines TaxID=307491 RepID=A0A6G0U5F1_APHGL|nr:hypothetical protein AGLY_001973 [Aphis glycines]
MTIKSEQSSIIAMGRYKSHLTDERHVWFTSRNLTIPIIKFECLFNYISIIPISKTDLNACLNIVLFKYSIYQWTRTIFFCTKNIDKQKKSFPLLHSSLYQTTGKGAKSYGGMINIYFEQIIFEFWGQNTIGIIKTVIGTNILKNHRFSLKGGTTSNHDCSDGFQFPLFPVSTGIIKYLLGL